MLSNIDVNVRSYINCLPNHLNVRLPTIIKCLISIKQNFKIHPHIHWEPKTANEDNVAQEYCAHFCQNTLSNELHSLELAARYVTFSQVNYIEAHYSRSNLDITKVWTIILHSSSEKKRSILAMIIKTHFGNSVHMRLHWQGLVNYTQSFSLSS